MPVIYGRSKGVPTIRHGTVCVLARLAGVLHLC